MRLLIVVRSKSQFKKMDTSGPHAAPVDDEMEASCGDTIPFKSVEDLVPVKAPRYSSLLWFRLRSQVDYQLLRQIAANIAGHFEDKSKVISGIGLQVAQVDLEQHGLLIAQCKKGCSLLETTIARMVLNCEQKCHIIDWGKIPGLTATAPIREHFVGQVESRVQGVGVITGAESSDEEGELELIDTDYNLLSRQ
jgi:hypothetical protein